MRWIAASLIVLNVLVLGGQLLMPRDERVEQAQIPPAALELEGTPLRLLSELDEARLKAMRSSRELSLRSASMPLEVGPRLCTLVGPFPKLLRAEYFVERLAALGLMASIQELEIPGDAGYWVHLPPRDSQKQAFNQLREMQAEGIDSYVIPKGELANGISFGMFSRSELAQSRLEDMRSRGYQAELTEVVRSFNEIWVVLPPGQAGRLSVETWQKMLAEGKELERRQNFCPSVASE